MSDPLIPTSGRPGVADRSPFGPGALLITALILVGLAVVLPFFIVLPLAIVGAAPAFWMLGRTTGTARVMTVVALVLFGWMAVESLLLAANAFD